MAKFRKCEDQLPPMGKVGTPAKLYIIRYYIGDNIGNDRFLRVNAFSPGIIRDYHKHNILKAQIEWLDESDDVTKIDAIVDFSKKPIRKRKAVNR